mgnify:CR=1 FL=1
MNCTIWRSTSMPAHFWASSANAIVALDIVISFKDSGWWVAPQPYPDSRWPPVHEERQRLLSRRFGLRPTRLDHQKNVRHFRGHYLDGSRLSANMINMAAPISIHPRLRDPQINLLCAPQEHCSLSGSGKPGPSLSNVSQPESGQCASSRDWSASTESSRIGHPQTASTVQACNLRQVFPQLQPHFQLQ